MVASGDPRRPWIAWVLLILEMVLVGVVLWRVGRLTPQIVPDTASYSEFPWESPRQALSQMRTPGYPAFLKLAAFAGSDHRAVPTAQMLVYFAATGFFFATLVRTTGAVGLSFAAASGLLFANILHGYVATAAADTLAAAVGIAACSFTLQYAANRSLPAAGGLAVAAAAGWLVRPAYLFLVVLGPILGALIAPRFLDAGVPRGRIGTGIRIALLTFAPLLLYCGLRWTLVGQFGVVSFGGYNLVGITGQFLTPTDIDSLPADLRPIAETVLAQRMASTTRVSDHDHEPVGHYLRTETRYDHTIWDEFTPAARQTATAESASLNTRLRKLGTLLLQRHPREYAVWLVKATRQGAKKLTWDLLDNPVGLIASLLLLGALTLRLSGSGEGFATTAAEGTAMRILTTVGLVYAALNLAVVIPVCPPLGRFTDAAGLFAGSLLLAALWCVAASLVRTRREIRNSAPRGHAGQGAVP